MSVQVELKHIVSNNQFYKNGLAPRNAKALKCILVADEGIIPCPLPFSLRKMLETNASNFAKGSILSQAEPDRKWYSLVFYLKKFSLMEINYDIYDKEISIIINSFKQWEHWLIGSLHPVLVYIDYKNLEYFIMMKVLNRK